MHTVACGFLFFVQLARCQRVNCTKNESTQAKTTQTLVRQALGVLFWPPEAQGALRGAVLRREIEN